MTPNVFVFQSLPERFDLRQKLIEGQPDTWYATRYRGEMKPGDIVFFWMAGDAHFRGMYGWGRLTSPPYIEDGWKAHGVDVLYECKFSQRITPKEISADDELARMLLFRAPQATNFLLTETEAPKLIKLVLSKNERAPVLEPAL